ATSLGGGARAGAAAAFGCTLGILPAITAALLGLSAVLHAGALAYLVLKYAGAAYLLYLAWQTWRDRGPVSLTPAGPRPALRIAWTGFLINVLNPKLSVFFMAFLPQFLDPAVAATPQILAMSAVFMGLTYAVFLVYGGLAAALGGQLRRPAVTAWIRRTAALAFAGLGARLALSDR
ncbi:MAG: LysE family translocator, partial [Pseudomonadota bacterium]